MKIIKSKLRLGFNLAVMLQLLNCFFAIMNWGINNITILLSIFNGSIIAITFLSLVIIGLLNIDDLYDEFKEHI